MTEREINAAVATKLGWERDPEFKSHLNKGRVRIHEKFLDFCHDIKAAWEITEHPDIVWRLVQSPSGWWTAEGQKIGDGDCTKHEDKEAAMALCGAFLKILD